MKVFSKKKAADRTQHNLRSFSAPLRPPPLSPSSATLPTPVGAETTTNGTPSRGAGGEGGGAGADAGKPDTNNPIIKITVPANLPVDAGDVVERLKCSMMAFKQVWRRVAPEGGFWGRVVLFGRTEGRCKASAFSWRHPSLPSPGLSLARSAHVPNP